MEIGDLPDAVIAKQFLRQLDQELAGLNFLWRARRKEGVIGAPRLWRLPTQTFEAFMRLETQRRGTGDFQYKHPGLVREEKWIENFSPVDIIGCE